MSAYHVAELRRARALVENGSYAYICHALRDDMANRWSAESAAVRDICTVIEARLGGCFTLGTWIRQNHGHLLGGRRSVTEGLQVREQLRLTRLAWIDSLIEEFS